MNQCDRKEDPMSAYEQLTSGARLLQRVNCAREKGEQNATEDLVFLENLIRVESL